MALSALVAAPASAQTTTSSVKVELASTGVTVQRKAARDDANFPFWISRQDCIDEATLTFKPKVSGVTDAARNPLQVWVSSSVDCTAYDQRHGSSARCSQVAEVQVPSELSPTVIVKARDVALAAASTQGEDAQNQGEREDCDAEVEKSLTFFFMVVNGDGEAQGTVAKWEDTQIDLVGPPPPDELTTGIGEQKLILEWEIAEADERQDTDHFNFYCDFATNPETMQGEGGLSSGGAGGEAGGTGTGTGTGMGGASSISDDPTCGPGSLVPGDFPPASKRCGGAQGLVTREGRAKPLQNNRRYAVGIAAVDRVGNPGRLSKVACGTPEPVTTFFEEYRAAGGEGGGGYCSFGAAPASGVLYSALAAGAAWFVRRRRKRA